MKTKCLSLLLAVCLFAALTACGEQTKHNIGFEAMDTYMQLTVYGEQQVAGDIKDDIQRLDGLLSTTDKGSDIYAVNQNGAATVDEAVADVTRQSLALCQSTGGALDITVYPVVDEWGFISKDFKIPSEKRLAQLLTAVDYTKVKLDGSTLSLPKNAKLDFGAVAKGYAADKALDRLKSSGSSGAILNLGGTVAAYGEKPGGADWRVGIADPDNSASYMGYLDCKNKIVATSGSYERYFKGDDGKIYSHIINPKTGCPVDNGIVSVSVVSDSGVRCDGLSTALFVMGKGKAEAYYHAHRDFEMILLTADKKAYVTGGIFDRFTLADGYDFTVEKI